MNIFVVDEDPERAARSLCDQHVVKMTLESAQILSTALWTHGFEAPYKPTHAKHPCVLWAGRTRHNFLWLARHGVSMADEFTRRYGKPHRSGAVLLACAARSHHIPRGDLSPFAQAMPAAYKQDDAVRAYRAFYIADKSSFARWSYCDPPAWWPT